jgi:RimJ/RimL family protein N-acetyltransferase
VTEIGGSPDLGMSLLSKNRDVTLLPAADEDFAWMLGEAEGRRGLRLPPGGVDAPEILAMLRERCRTAWDDRGYETWMIVADREVVGLCGFKAPSDADAAVEIGYGIALGRRRRGYATAAVRRLLEIAAQRGFKRLIADVAHGNEASRAVLRRNGFAPGRDCGPDAASWSRPVPGSGARY